MDSWSPSPEGLRQIVTIFQNSLSPDSNIQRQILQELQELDKRPDFIFYLLCIFQDKQYEPFVRQLAGLQLKRIFHHSYPNQTETARAFVRNTILRNLGDDNQAVRETSGSLISTAVGYCKGFGEWPALLPGLVQAMESQTQFLVHGGLAALGKLCEDHYLLLMRDPSKPLNVLIPKLLSMTGSEVDEFRKLALAALNQFLLDMPGALTSNMGSFVEVLGRLANDSDMEVRVEVCFAFTALVERRPEHVASILQDIIRYMMVHTVQEEHDRLAVFACDFWWTFANSSSCRDALGPHLGALVPILLRAMRYSDDDFSLLEAQLAEDTDKPDKDSEVAPRFQNAREMAGESDYQIPPGWTLRKSASLSLDKLALVFREDLLRVLLPHVENNLQSSDWLNVEVAILSLGAASSGCGETLKEFLPNLVPYLLQHLQHQKALVVTITCWTLGKFTNWMVQPAHREQYFLPTLGAMLQCVTHGNKKVQEASCSALAFLIDGGHDCLGERVEFIMGVFVKAYEQYQRKSLYVLYDAIYTLVDVTPLEYSAGPIQKLLIPALERRWEAVGFLGQGVDQILECYSVITLAMGPQFQSYGPLVFERSLSVVRELNKVILQEFDEQKCDTVTYALNVLSAIVRAFKGGVGPILHKSDLGTVIFESLKIEDPLIRQNCVALLGDLAHHAIDYIRPGIRTVIEFLIQAVDPQYETVCNNSAWALSTIALQTGDDFVPYLDYVVDKYLSIYSYFKHHAVLMRNVSLAFGRLCYAFPERLSRYLDRFLGPWCANIRTNRSDDDRKVAYVGMCKCIRANPSGALPWLADLCDAFVWYDTEQPDDVVQEMGKLLHGFKNEIGSNDFERILAESSLITNNHRKFLQDRFGV